MIAAWCRRAIRLGSKWAAVAALALALFASPLLAADPNIGTASVIDADTIELHGTRIRLLGIDAPEGEQTCDFGGRPWRCGTDAAFALADHIEGKSIECRGDDLDRYGRTLATCFLGAEDLNAWLVFEGWAVAYWHYSSAYVPQEDAARTAQRGIWASEFQMPWDWRAAQRGTSSIERNEMTPLPVSCCKVCTTGKACGNSCISRLKNCHKPPGCACDG